MEQLQTMLREYNISHQEKDTIGAGWNSMYQSVEFPLYWQYVYKIADKLDRNLKVLEIGSGFGFITSIFAYLGYSVIIGFEHTSSVATSANKRLESLFDIQNCINNTTFYYQKIDADILVLVNCVYSDGIESKDDYINLLMHYYNMACQPRYFILEVIDSSYTEENSTFPSFVRLSKNDICGMFPTSQIKYWETYIYPKNKTSKTLYLIEKT